MPSLPQRLTDLLIAWRYPLLGVAVVAALVALPAAWDLDLDRTIETMFAPDDPDLAVYEKLKRTFGGNEIVLAVYVDEHLLDPDAAGIRRLRALSERLAEVPGVQHTLSLDQPLGDAVVEPGNPLAARGRKLFEGYTHGADGQTAAVICVLRPQWESETPPRRETTAEEQDTDEEVEREVPPRRETIDRLRGIMAEIPTGMIAGEPVMVADGFRYVEEDGRRLGWTTTLLMAAVIALNFRSLRWMIVPLAVVQWALVATRASLDWSGLELTMVSSMLTAIITVTGVAAVVHLIVKFREGRTEGLSPKEALSWAGGRLAAPIFWTGATDAAGFLSLMAARVGPLQDFGLMMSLGSMMVILALALVAPGLTLAGHVGTDPKKAWGEGRLDAELGRWAGWVRRRPLAIAATTVLVVGVAAAGIGHLEVETDFTKNFRSDTPVVKSYQFVETHLGGAGVWDVIVPAPEPLNWDFLSRVGRFEDRLRREVTVPGPDGTPNPGLTKVLSLADCIQAGSPVDLDGLRLSTIQNMLMRKGIADIREQMPGMVELLYGEDRDEPGRHYLRIMLRAREQQPAAAKRSIVAQVRRIAAEEFPPAADAPGAEVGGIFVLLSKLVESILRDQWLTFSVALGAIGLMMLAAFRSPVLALVALVPNTLPILVVTGLLGWAGVLWPGVKINMGAAMIAAVSLGISIDSSIHYIAAFQRARREGRSVADAIAGVEQSVGRAVVFATIALILGFFTLATSRFIPSVYFGVLVSLTMLGGLVGNLLVLPLLLRLVVRDR